MPKLSLTIKTRPNYNPAGYVGILNKYPGAVGAWSLRLLDTTYTGPIIRAYRVSDGALQDIYALSNGQLDTTSLLSFAGGGDVLIETYYDQSGNNYHASGAPVAEMATIVQAGSLLTDAQGIMYASVPTPSRMGVFDSIKTISVPYTLYSVSGDDGLSEWAFLTYIGGPDYAQYYNESPERFYHAADGTVKYVVINSIIMSVPKFMSTIHRKSTGTTDVDVYYNNVYKNTITFTTDSLNLNFYNLGGYGSPYGNRPAYFYEFLLYNNDYNTNLELDLNSYYQIF